MASVKTYEFIRDNLELVKQLVKAGFLSPKVIEDYDTYQKFLEHKSESICQRYEDIAEDKRCSFSTIKNAVLKMRANFI